MSEGVDEHGCVPRTLPQGTTNSTKVILFGQTPYSSETREES